MAKTRRSTLVAGPGRVATWRAIGSTVRGASHIRADMPNQDAITWLPASGAGQRMILAVSDGHGSAKSFRSHLGSTRAVEAAAWVLQDLLDGQPDPTNFSAIKRTAEEHLPREILREWVTAVEQHLQETPFTRQELALLAEKNNPSAVQLVEANPLLAYGATVLVVLATEQFILYLQLGDGDILTVSESGEVQRPLPEDSRLFANQTTSLCVPNAWRDFRVRLQPVLDVPPALIILATDGYANSFANEEDFVKVASDTWEIMRAEGLEAVNENLEGWLTEATQAGSGDDITLGLLCREAALPSAEERALLKQLLTAAEAAQQAETPPGLWIDNPGLPESPAPTDED